MVVHSTPVERSTSSVGYLASSIVASPSPVPVPTDVVYYSFVWDLCPLNIAVHPFDSVILRFPVGAIMGVSAFMSLDSFGSEV